ncbi:hypothetical protein [Acaryochloris sp. CCMEE 5410]|uniref:hypothetical protein n=1 Tax=Acaryochloris sp. CCMEE 5410 TaxID=310037 RepID=UPI0021D2C1C6|nr:hypothetical protein [Acaryochloris sp. CCMEE 5410]
MARIFRFDKQIEARDDDFTDVPCVIKVAGPTPEDWHRECWTFYLIFAIKGILLTGTKLHFFSGRSRMTKLLPWPSS